MMARRRYAFFSTWLPELPMPLLHIHSTHKLAFGNDTVSETRVHAAVLVDVGELTLGRKNTLFAGVGYEYWKNKFGNNSANTPGTEANTPFLNLEWHL